MHSFYVRDPSSVVTFLLCFGGVILLGIVLSVAGGFDSFNAKDPAHYGIEVQKAKANHLRAAASRLQEQLQRRATAAEALNESLAEATAALAMHRAERSDLLKSLPSKKSALAALKAESLAYRRQVLDSYARNNIGRELATLTTRNGKIYHDVEIRRVTATGVLIRHSFGSAGLAPEDLPEDLANELLFPERLRIAAMEAERMGRNRATLAIAFKNPTAKKAPVPTPLTRPVAAPSIPKPPIEQDASNGLQEEQTLRREIFLASSRLLSLENQAIAAQAHSGFGRYRSASVPGSLETWKTRSLRLSREADAVRAQLTLLRVEWFARYPHLSRHICPDSFELQSLAP